MKTILITPNTIVLENKMIAGSKSAIVTDEEKVSEALYEIMKANPEVGKTVNSACMMWLATFEVDEV